jgi:hypothetical protein
MYFSRRYLRDDRLDRGLLLHDLFGLLTHGAPFHFALGLLLGVIYGNILELAHFASPLTLPGLDATPNLDTMTEHHRPLVMGFLLFWGVP